ncbi:serine protease family S08A [Achlya hypogyna]|uniref:subtilisin n=1 Tax=Achlya hypogyna TaxID=1202772 RepID=A0A0A7CNY3_ACHHY|nr:secreted protein [Achlya hypogyna]OQR98069.1 serine protease family S08A [Achlya hypogyna]
MPAAAWLLRACLFLVLLGAVAATPTPPTGDHRKIDIDVWNDLHAQPTVDAIVEFEGLQKFWADKTEHADLDQPSSNARVRDFLQAVAAEAQANARNILEGKVPHRRRLESAPEVCPGLDDMEIQDLWVANQFKVFALSLCVAEQLSSLPRVRRVRYGYAMAIGGAAADASPAWGVATIGAPAAWAVGLTGQGVVVGSIDSGVRSSHEALAANFRGAYGWYDAVNGSATPLDENGHGTHTMGTLAGGRGVGVAPGATWMACRACSAASCLEADLLECMQFMLCPTDVFGKNADCSKAPRVVSNSWGAGATDLGSYKAAIEAWRRAGIIPVFSNGNTGAGGCSSVQSPADYDNVISVGNVDASGLLSPTSSRGPTKAGVIKPTISAPGSAITSASNKGDGSYATMSGTSMAAPHVAGAIALLLGAHPSYGYDDVLKALTTTATTASLQATTPAVCGAVPATTFPNNLYGYGLLSISNAVAVAPNASTPGPSVANATAAVVTSVPTSANASTVSPVVTTNVPVPSGSMRAPTTAPAPTLPPSMLSGDLNTDVLLVTPRRQVLTVANYALHATSLATATPATGATMTYSPTTQQLVATANGECVDASPLGGGAFVLRTWPCRLSNINQRWVVRDRRIQHGRHRDLCLAVVATTVGVASCDSDASSQALSALPRAAAMEFLSS